MRVRYHEMVGKRVIAADGQEAGRVVDLVAEGRGDALRVTALLVGPTAFLRRIGFRHGPLFGILPTRRIGWDAVAHVNKDIRLRVNLADLEPGETVALPTPAKEGAAEAPEG